MTYKIQWLDTPPFGHLMRIVHVTVAPSIGAPLFKQAEETQITIKNYWLAINQMNLLLFCLQKLWKIGLFHQLFEPLKIHQTISNSNQTIHKTLYLMRMDKSGSKNNNFRSLIWKGGSGVLTTISVGFAPFPNLPDIYTIIRPSN